MFPRVLLLGWSRARGLSPPISIADGLPADRGPAHPIPQTPFPDEPDSGEGGWGHGARARRESAARVALRFVRAALSRQLFSTGYSLLNPDLYKYTGPDGQVFIVDKTAGLKSLTDRAGNVLTMTPLGISSQHPQVAGSSIGIVFQCGGAMGVGSEVRNAATASRAAFGLTS